LGDHVRRQRLALGLTQRTLARRLGVREESVASWEGGLSQPLVRRWPGIIRFLGYNPALPRAGLADRVRAYRREHGLTQADLGRQLGLDEGTIVDLEAGRRTSSQRVVRLVNGALKSALTLTLRKR
jgi:DNA-binding XRE family transcriptional regulator